MMDPIRRNVLATGAAATAMAAVPQVFAQQAPQAGAAATSFYEKGNVRIRYTEVGSGFPLLATPGGGLNSRISNWPNAVINVMEHFKNDFRCITMDQRNASNGESTGPVPVDDPWGAFADDQLGLMDHLGIRQFFFFGNCIGGPFAMKLMERAPERVVAAVLSQPVGHRPEQPDQMYNSGKNVWAKEFLARRPDVSMETIEKYLHNLYRVRLGLRVQRVARLRAFLPDADAGPAGRHACAPAPDIRRHRIAGAECRDHRISLEGAARAQGPDHQPGSHLPEAAPTCDGGPLDPAERPVTRAHWRWRPGMQTLGRKPHAVFIWETAGRHRRTSRSDSPPRWHAHRRASSPQAPKTPPPA